MDCTFVIAILVREHSHATEKAEHLLGWTQRTPEEIVLEAVESLAQLGLIKSDR